MSVPASLSFPQTKPVSVQAVASKFSSLPVSGTSFAGGSIISIDLVGCGQRGNWLDCSGTMLNFTVTVALTAGTAPTWSAHGYNFIQSLNLYSSAGSSQIESIQNYGALHAILRDLCTSQDMVRTKDTIILGSDPTRLRSPVVNTYGTTTTATYSIPLISVIGVLSGGDRYLPIHALSSPLRLDIEVASALTALASGGTAAATGATIALTGVSLDCNYVTLSDSAQNQIASLTNNEYVWTSSVWKSFRTVHAAGQLSNTIMIPSRVESMKSLLVAQREAAAEFDIAKSSVHQRLRNLTKQYQVRCGSVYITPVPISCAGGAIPAYLETTKIFSNPASENVCGLLASDNWTKDVDVPPTTTSVEGAFVIGCSLEAFASNKLISGQSTSANTLVLELAYTSAPLAVNIDSFCESDAQFLISGATGMMQVAF